MFKFRKKLAIILAFVMVIMLSGCSVLSDIVGGDSAIGLQKLNGHAYLISDLGFTWTEAEAYCEYAGGHLVTITSEKEQNFITKLLDAGAKKSYWIGAQENVDTGNFEQWVTGEKFNYTCWSKGNPDNFDDTEDSLMIYKDKKLGKWNDLNDDGSCNNIDSEFFGKNNIGLIIEWESEKEGRAGLNNVISQSKFLEIYNAAQDGSDSSGKTSATGKNSSQNGSGKSTQGSKSTNGKSGGSTASPNGKSSGIPVSKIKKAGDLFSFLKIPNNYHCKLILSMDGTSICNGEYWYKDGKAKLNASISAENFNMATLSYINTETGVLYTCIPSQNIAIKTSMGKDAYIDQSSIADTVDSDLKFIGTKAVTVDGIQCTVYAFSESGCTTEIYVRNSLEIIIRCVVKSSSNTVDVYFKNMDIGSVTAGDVLMTNNRYKIFNNYQDYTNYLLQQALGK